MIGVDAATVALAFDLGEPTGPLRPLPGLSAASVYGLTTDRGDWVVKLAATPPGPAASELERAARAAGVATPLPVEPPEPAIGYWTRVADRYARVSAAVTGNPPPIPAPPALATWLGRTVATVTGLGLRGDPLPPAAARPWRDLLPAQHQGLAGTLDPLSDLVDHARRDPPPSVLAHRDMNARNILITPAGPVLLDFDHSGPTPAWWELIHQTMLLSCRDLGAEEPDPTCVRTAVDAYASAGGAVGPADPTAFAGLIAGLLDWVAENAADEPTLRQASASLPLVLRSLDRWSALVGGVA